MQRELIGSQCFCESSTCGHGRDFCPLPVDQDSHELMFLAGEGVCQRCIDDMRRDHPQWVLEIGRV